MISKPPLAIPDSTMAYHIDAQCNHATESISATIAAAQPIHAMEEPRYANFWSHILNAPRRGLECCAVLCLWSSLTPAARQNIATAEMMISAGWKIKWARESMPIHATTWLFDQERAIIGSHNLTPQSLHQSAEFSILTAEPAFIAAISQWQAQVWAKATPHFWRGEAKSA